MVCPSNESLIVAALVDTDVPILGGEEGLRLTLW
jgi:hypothetical protein